MRKAKKIITLLLSAVSIALCVPMEPAKSTLFILLDGLNPANKGLLQNYCVDYENSEVWGKTGAAKYLQENIVNAKTNIYSRSYKNPAEAPSAMVAELAGHENSKEKVSCLEKKWFYDASSKKYKYQNGSQKELTSIVDEALEQWYVDILNEVQLPLTTSASRKSDVQMRREAWSGERSFYTPNASYFVDSTAIDSYFHKWMNDYKNKNGVYPSLETIKTERPDFLPSRYVFIANGMGGMVAREYIQGVSYQGDVNKILFVNTPHEGSGFADQALLSKGDMYNLHSIEGAVDNAVEFLIPVVVSLYSFTDLDKDVLLDFTKKLIDATAALTNISVNSNINQYFFSSYNVTDKALWYLAQDADQRDVIYEEAFDAAKEKNVDSLIGRIQMINSQGMLSSYSDPIYRLMYSYGMPSVGNGRRTIFDYLFQKKNHVDKNRLNEEILKQMSEFTASVFIKDLGVPKHVARNISVRIYGYMRELYAKDNWFIEKGASFGAWLTEKIDKGDRFIKLLEEDGLDIANINAELAAYGSADLANWGLNKLLSSAIKTATEKYMEWTWGYVLDWIDLGKHIDNLKDKYVKIISYFINVIPQKYQQEFVAAFISSYSPRYEGMDVASGNCSLGNYNSINPKDWVDFGSNVIGSFSGSFFQMVRALQLDIII